MTTLPRYSNLKNIPTVKIQEILDSAPYYTTDKGTDYGPVKEELERILWERGNRAQKWELVKGKHKGDLDKALAEMEAREIMPPVPELERTMLICEIRESWRIESENGFSYIEVAIPPRLMPF